MTVFREIKVGDVLPNAKLARLTGEMPEPVNLHDLIDGKAVVIFGVPGAFAPTCSRHHVPNMVANQPKLRASGIDRVICIAPNDPWVLASWAGGLDPDRRITFLSDGNLDFTTRAGLRMEGFEVFLGLRSKRFLMVVENKTVRRFSAEKDVLSFTCTMAERALD
jgi:peroxiredoxin